jgi:hypothetical protein
VKSVHGFFLPATLQLPASDGQSAIVTDAEHNQISGIRLRKSSLVFFLSKEET